MYPPTHSWKSEDSSSTLNTGTQWVRGSKLTKHQLMIASSITQQCNFWLLFLQPGLCTNQSWDKATGSGETFFRSSAKKEFPDAKKAKKCVRTPRKQLFLLPAFCIYPQIKLAQFDTTLHCDAFRRMQNAFFLQKMLQPMHLSCIVEVQ